MSIQVQSLFRRLNSVANRNEGGLMHFDLRGRGTVIEVIGNLDDADYLVIIVPGARTKLKNFDDFSRAGLALRDNLRKLFVDEIENRVAVICWLGYESPDLRQAWRRKYARNARPALNHFLSEMQAYVDAEAHIAVIGHSYGSLVAGIAS